MAKSRWFVDVAGKQIMDTTHALPAERVADLEERGRARDLDATMGDLLGEFCVQTGQPFGRRATAYVFVGTVCRGPIVDPAVLSALLGGS